MHNYVARFPPCLSFFCALSPPLALAYAGPYAVLTPDVASAAAMARRAVVATLVRFTGCTELYTAALRTVAAEGGRMPIQPPPDTLASVWATALSTVSVLFHTLVADPDRWPRASRQHSAVQLARRVAHNCAFLRMVHPAGACGVLSSSVYPQVSAANVKYVWLEECREGWLVVWALALCEVCLFPSVPRAMLSDSFLSMQSPVGPSHCGAIRN
jgi:hypothetical protein